LRVPIVRFAESFGHAGRLPLTAMKTRIALAQINVSVGDFAGNVAKTVGHPHRTARRDTTRDHGNANRPIERGSRFASRIARSAAIGAIRSPRASPNRFNEPIR